MLSSLDAPGQSIVEVPSVFLKVGATENKRTEVVKVSETIFNTYEKLLLRFKDASLQREFYKHDAYTFRKYRLTVLITILILWIAFIITDLKAPPPLYKYLIIRAAGAALLLFLSVWGLIPRRVILNISFSDDSEFIMASAMPIVSILLLVYTGIAHDASMPFALYLVSICIFLVSRVSWVGVLINAAVYYFGLSLLVLWLEPYNSARKAEIFTYFISAGVSGGVASYSYNKKLRANFLISRMSTSSTILQVYDIMTQSKRITLAFQDRTLEQMFWDTNWNKNVKISRGGVFLSLGSLIFQTITYYVFSVDTADLTKFWVVRAVLVCSMLAFILLTFINIRAKAISLLTLALLLISYTGFQYLEKWAENQSVRELYRLSIINSLFFFIAMQTLPFYIYFLACIAIEIIHTSLSPDYFSVLDLGFCFIAGCLICYLLEIENRRNFLWKHFCVSKYSGISPLNSVTPLEPNVPIHPTPAWDGDIPSLL